MRKNNNSTITKKDIKDLRYAIVKDLRIDLKRFATKEDLNSMEKEIKNELKSYATKDDLKNELKQYATKDDLKKWSVDLIDKMMELDDITRNEIRKDIEGLKDEIIRVFGNRFENYEKRLVRFENCATA